ncbi:MAG: DUF1501 domain-containing protein [Verrucomicrobiia bacterium]|jgi:uncharacterized protein (DUF1501 family)
MAANSQLALSGDGDQRQTLIAVFLRGGADGLNMVAPFEDDGYFKARPRIAIKKEDSVQLDDFFGLNPLLSELERPYKDGNLAIVHAAGSEDDTRSHFEAQDLMEHGGLLMPGGWLGRFLRALPDGGNGPLSAVAVGRSVPECLRGAPASTVMESLDSFSLGKKAERMTAALTRLYGLENNALGNVAKDTFGAMKRIEKLRNEKYIPGNDAEYSYDEFSRGMQQVARLIKARVGLTTVSIDIGGWDSHFVQSSVMDPLMPRLAKGLNSFYTDLGREMENTTVVVMTEFGRRVYENASFGTDHGRGSVMFVMGGGVKGGRVIADWPSLDDKVLEGPGDLPVTTNYRNVLAPILSRFGIDDKMRKVFPDYDLKPLDLFG